MNGQQPRILLVDLAARFGGATARALNLLAALPPGQGAIAGLEGGPAVATARAHGLEAYAVGRSKSDPRIVSRLRRLLHVHHFTVMDTVNPQSKLWGSLAVMGTDVALVSTLNSWYEAEHEGRLKGRFYQALERASHRRTNMFITVAPDIQRQLIRAGVEEDAAALILNAIAIDRSLLQPDGRDHLLREFKLPADAIISCAVGRLVEAKGFPHLINSMRLAGQERGDLRCLIVGEGHLRTALEEQIAGAGLQGRVILAGFRQHDDVLRIVNACDLFLMPSVTEGTPIGLLEAMALGKPIIASRVGGIPAVVTDGGEALLIEPGDEAGLAQAILRLAADSTLARRLGSAAEQRARQDFALEVQVQATLDVYRKALQRREASRGDK